MGRDHAKHSPDESHETRLSRASVGRLSLYLRRLEALLTSGVHRVSSAALGDALHIPDTQVRKDLAPLDSQGLPGIGYEVADLIRAIRSTLGLDRSWSAVLVGVGNLARALLRYQGFPDRGFRIVALIDDDPTKVGKFVDGLIVTGLDRAGEVVRRTGAELGIITVPLASAQKVADHLVEEGVKGILNFAPGLIRTPPGVSLVNVDLTVQLEQLAFLVHLNKSEE